MDKPVSSTVLRDDPSTGFPPDTVVDVEEIDDVKWQLLKEIKYHGASESFAVPVGQHADFASVPRILIWFLPRYGRYTKAAILHDCLGREGTKRYESS
jgi:hypothetical protein